MLSKIAMP